jgi:hypothetical protein
MKHMPRVDDALQFLIAYLRQPRSRSEGASYGYDLYIPNVCRAFATNVERISSQNPLDIEARLPELSAAFYEAAWELCRRGIIRPGVRRHQEQVTADGSGGNGYSLTSMGRAWLARSEGAVFIPVEPARVAELIGRFRERFGEGFFQRAQEAVRCHSATTYLACCVMCGAAAESILLHLAIRRRSSEGEVLRIYRSASGRRRVEDLVLTGVSAHLAGTFRNLTDLLKYWRDDASHGIASEISEFEAYEAVARLLRFAHFASDHYAVLTGQNTE